MRNFEVITLYCEKEYANFSKTYANIAELYPSSGHTKTSYAFICTLFRHLNELIVSLKVLTNYSQSIDENRLRIKI